MYWATEEPIRFEVSSYPEISAEFHQLLGELGLVLNTAASDAVRYYAGAWLMRNSSGGRSLRHIENMVWMSMRRKKEIEDSTSSWGYIRVLHQRSTIPTAGDD